MHKIELQPLLRQVVTLTKAESMDLEAKGKAGDLDALKLWVLYAGWEKLEQDRTIKPKMKIRLFKHILQLVELSAEATTEDVGAEDFDVDDLAGLRLGTDDPAGSRPVQLHVHDPITVAGTTLCKGCGVQSFG